MNRELDLGRLMQSVGKRLAEEGQATSQRLHDWKRIERIPAGRGNCGGCGGEGYVYEGIEQVQCDDCKGTGDGAGSGGPGGDTLQDRQASRMLAEWARVRLQLEQLSNRACFLMDQAKADHAPLDKHRTPAQVEADGWCGAHWRQIGELVPVSLRPTGEPYYKGRCLFCGRWPEGDPPADVLRQRRDGKTVRVVAS